MKDWGEEAAEGLVFQDAAAGAGLLDGGDTPRAEGQMPWQPVLLTVRGGEGGVGYGQAPDGQLMNLEVVLRDLHLAADVG